MKQVSHERERELNTPYRPQVTTGHEEEKPSIRNDDSSYLPWLGLAIIVASILGSIWVHFQNQ